MKEKRILLLGDANSAHLERWSAGMITQGFKVGIFSLSQVNDSTLYRNLEIDIFQPRKRIDENRFWASLFQKVAYLAAFPSLKLAISAFKPDIIHAHYASSYGLLGALSGFHPFCISAWGSDLLSFPKLNFLTNRVLRFNLSKADRILVTSNELFKSAKLYTSKKISIIPFGIDPNLYTPVKHSNTTSIAFGSAKALTPVYGHEIALQAFASIKNVLPDNSHFLIAGSGRSEPVLKALAKRLGITNQVSFLGKLKKEDIPQFIGSLDILVNLSLNESFGVVILEAAACEVPAIASDTGGIPEVIKNNETGILVKTGDIAAAAAAMLMLAKDHQKRMNMGKAARIFILEKYTWEKSLEKMTDVYLSLLS